jgi:hypothetical protein
MVDAHGLVQVVGAWLMHGLVQVGAWLMHLLWYMVVVHG